MRRDETKISLYGSNGRKYVRRRTEGMLHSDCIQATVKFPQFYDLVMHISRWYRSSSYHGWNMECQKIDTILEPKLLPSIRGLFTNNASFIFQKDSVPCHTVK
ncbi:transposable element Tcb1 transposase [Trichonephila clavipes]|nr:transposable element Tcb1 transposase [Trichonephila clavipes]